MAAPKANPTDDEEPPFAEGQPLRSAVDDEWFRRPVAVAIHGGPIEGRVELHDLEDADDVPRYVIVRRYPNLDEQELLGDARPATIAATGNRFRIATRARNTRGVQRAAEQVVAALFGGVNGIVHAEQYDDGWCFRVPAEEVLVSENAHLDPLCHNGRAEVILHLNG